METYSSFQKPITFMYFWLNYCDKNRIERIPVAVKDIDHLFNMTSEIVEADSLHLFLSLTALELMIIDCFLFIEAIISSTSLVLFKVFFNILYIWL